MTNESRVLYWLLVVLLVLLGVWAVCDWAVWKR